MRIADEFAKPIIETIRNTSGLWSSLGIFVELTAFHYCIYDDFEIDLSNKKSMSYKNVRLI